MARLEGIFVTGPNAAGQSPMNNLALGGQNGFAPNLTEWHSNQAYISKPLVCIVVELPLGFNFLPDPQFWRTAYKALLETHAKTIEGFQAGITVEFAENAVSGGGEMQQDPTNVTRERTKPVFGFVDKYGRPIQSFLYELVTNLIMDPDSKVPNVVTLPGIKPTDLIADMYSATILCFEPDPSFTSINKAWLTTNFWPIMSGAIEGKRDLTQAGAPSELSIEFSGLSSSTLGVRAFAQQILNNINVTNANPYLRPSFVSRIDPNVEAAGRGYKEQAEELGATAISRG